MNNYEHAKTRVYDGIAENKSKKSKDFWLAYITGLVDFNVISLKEYQSLRDYIVCTES
jgi:hypothetical protein